MEKNISHKWILWAVILYFFVSILLIFWLQLVRIIFSEAAWQYEYFYGSGGRLALLWLLIALLPAHLVLLVKSHGKQFTTRLFGGVGFYCLLASLVSEQNYLAYPGVAFLVMSIIINRHIKRQSGHF